MTHQAVLIDRSTMDILSQSEDSLSGSLSDDSGFLGTIGEKIDEQDYDSISLDNNIVEFREISGTNWVLVSYVPEASIFAELVSLRTTMAIVASCDSYNSSCTDGENGKLHDKTDQITYRFYCHDGIG